MVAVLICSQARGGRDAFWIASPTARVESIRELIISFRFSSVYRQLTFRPARLMTTSAPSISRAQGPTVRASHGTTRAPPAPPLLRITASWPFAQRARTSTAPTCPLPPGTTIFIGSRSFGSLAWTFHRVIHLTPLVSNLRKPGGKALRIDEPQRGLGIAAREERATAAEDQRDDVDRELAHQVLAEEAADQRAAVDIDSADSLAIEPLGERARGARPQFLAVARLGRATGADDHPLAAVRPLRKTKHGIVCSAADYHRVDAGEEVTIAVVLAVKRLEPVEAAVRPGDEAVEADANEDGEAHIHRSSQRQDGNVCTVELSATQRTRICSPSPKMRCNYKFTP